MDGLVQSPCSPRDSPESSPTPQFKSINSSVLSFLYSPTLTSIQDSLSLVQFFATPQAVARQASLSMGFSRQESWSGLPFASPGDFPDPGIEPGSPALQGDSLPSELLGKTIISYMDRKSQAQFWKAIGDVTVSCKSKIVKLK